MTSRKIVWVAAAIACVIALAVVGRRAAALVPAFAAWVDSLGWVGAFVFMIGYVVATIAFVPGSLLTLAGGALFGLARGTLYVFVAATVGATAAFLIARYVARAAVLRRISGDARFRALDAAIAREGRKIVILIRLSPIFPFNLTNYALGLTGVRLRDYVFACIGMLPGTLLYVYYGRLIGDVARVVAGARVERGPVHWVVLGIGLVATLLVTVIVARAARRALNASVAPPA